MRESTLELNQEDLIYLDVASFINKNSKVVVLRIMQSDSDPKIYWLKISINNESSELGIGNKWSYEDAFQAATNYMKENG